jgi:hypothetical protein
MYVGIPPFTNGNRAIHFNRSVNLRYTNCKGQIFTNAFPTSQHTDESPLQDIMLAAMGVHNRSSLW